MKSWNILFLFIISFIQPGNIAADVDVIDFDIETTADANLVVSGGPYNDIYWLETDETEGMIVLRFQDSRLNELVPCESPFYETYQLRLKLSIPDIPDAGSEDGLIVFYNGLEVGRMDRISAGSDIIIHLNPCTVTPVDEILLTLRGAGPDGLAIKSKASGSGAALQVIIFPEGGGIGGYPMVEEDVIPEGRQ